MAVVNITMENPFWFIVKDMQGGYLDNGQSAKCLGYNDAMYQIETFTNEQDFLTALANYNLQ